MDAVNFDGRIHSQYLRSYIERELTKAFLAFTGDPQEAGHKPIATGRWGWGVFGGDP